MTTVSILVTAYNREKYIGQCLESILNSSFQDFEVIIVDDASKDKTVEIAKYFSTKDSRIKLYQNEVNLGQFGNRNKAAALANGKYIKYLDSDDLLYPYGLEVMINAMETNPEAGLGFSYTIGDSPWPLPKMLSSEEVYFLHYRKGGILFTGPSGLIIRKDIFIKSGGFEEFGMPSDNHLSLKVAALAPVVVLQRDLFWWRQHEDQAFSESKHSINILNNYLFNLNILNSSSCPTKIKERNIIRASLKRIFYINLLRLAMKNKKPSEAFSLWRKYKKYENSSGNIF